MILDFAEQLEKQIVIELDALMDLEELADKYKFKVDEQLEIVWRLRNALNAIQGKLELVVPETIKDPESGQSSLVSVQGSSGELPPNPPSPQRPPEPPDTRVLCPACGGRMEPSQRTLQSGKTVNLLMCVDSGCNNEVYA